MTESPVSPFHTVAAAVILLLLFHLQLPSCIMLLQSQPHTPAGNCSPCQPVMRMVTTACHPFAWQPSLGTGITHFCTAVSVIPPSLVVEGMLSLPTCHDGGNRRMSSGLANQEGSSSAANGSMSLYVLRMVPSATPVASATSGTYGVKG